MNHYPALIALLLALSLFFHFHQQKYPHRMLQGIPDMPFELTNTTDNSNITLQDYSNCKANILTGVKNTTRYRKEREKSLIYVETQEFMEMLHGTTTQIEQLHKAKYTQFIIGNDFTYIMIVILMFFIIFAVISSLCFKDDFPPKKYQRNLDIFPYSQVELYFPPLTGIIVSILIILLSAEILKDKNIFRDEYKKMKCNANFIGQGFLNGYNDNELIEYKPQLWVGIKKISSIVNVTKQQFMSSKIENALLQTFKETRSWLEFSMYSPQNGLKIAYAKNMDVKVKKPQCIGNDGNLGYRIDYDCKITLESSTYNANAEKQPDFIRQLGSMEREGTHLNNIFQEFNSSYLEYNKTVFALREQSEDLGNKASRYSQQTVENKIIDLNIIQENFEEQMFSLDKFFDMLDLSLVEIDALLETIYSTVFVIAGLTIFSITLIFVFNLKRLKAVLIFVQIIAELLIFVLLVSIFLIGLLNNASQQTCQNIELIFRDEKAYNETSFFKNKDLKEKLYYCFYQPQKKGDFNSSGEFVSLTQNITKVKNYITRLKDIVASQKPRADLVDNEVVKIFDEIFKHPPGAFSLDELDFYTNVQVQMDYLNSLTDRSFQYIDKDKCKKEDNCYLNKDNSLPEMYDQFQYNKEICETNFKEYIVYDNIVNAPPIGEKKKNCILIPFEEMRDFSINLNLRYKEEMKNKLINKYVFADNPDVITQITQIDEKLYQFWRDVYSKFQDLKTKLQNFQNDYTKLFNHVQTLNKRVFGETGNTKYIDLSYEKITEELIENLIDPLKGYEFSTNCNYLKYAMIAFEQNYCNEFMPSFIKVYQKVLLLWIILCIFIVIIFQTSQRVKHKSNESIIMKQFEQNKIQNGLLFTQKPNLKKKALKNNKL